MLTDGTRLPVSRAGYARLKPSSTNENNACLRPFSSCRVAREPVCRIGMVGLVKLATKKSGLPGVRRKVQPVLMARKV